MAVEAFAATWSDLYGAICGVVHFHIGVTVQLAVKRGFAGLAVINGIAPWHEIVCLVASSWHFSDRECDFHSDRQAFLPVNCDIGNRLAFFIDKLEPLLNLRNVA